MTSTQLDEIEARVNAAIPPSFTSWDGFVTWVKNHEAQMRQDVRLMIQELRNAHVEGSVKCYFCDAVVGLIWIQGANPGCGYWRCADACYECLYKSGGNFSTLITCGRCGLKMIRGTVCACYAGH